MLLLVCFLKRFIVKLALIMVGIAESVGKG